MGLWLGREDDGWEGGERGDDGWGWVNVGGGWWGMDVFDRGRGWRFDTPI